MNDSSRRPLAEQDATLLFEEYLAALDAGESVDVEGLARRAGAHAPELRKRMRVYAALQELSDTLQPIPDAGVDGQAPAAEDSLQELGRFQNLVQIGRGGSSSVLLAYDPKLGRRVALKVFSPRELGVRDARAWMRNEGRSLARLEHSGVVRVFDVDEADGHAYIAMEYVQGPSLRSVLDHLRSRERSSSEPPARAAHDAASSASAVTHVDSTSTPGALGAAVSMDEWTQASAQALESLPARVRLASKLARALHYCHAQGVIHRDIKPGNILLVAGNEPKLIDFGLAHSGSEEAALNQVTQRLVGTPAYLAPEQVDDSRTGASPASDQFALGTVLYELLTLTNPFQKETRDETLRSISRASPEPARKLNRSIPTDLDLILLHCLGRLPKDRYGSVGALADDLDSFLELRAISLQPPSPVKLLRLWVARHQRDVALAAVGIAILVASIMAVWVVDARRRRGALSDELQAQAVHIRDLTTPQEFQATYPVIYGMKRAARDLDRETVASIVGHDMETEAHALIDACSSRLADTLRLSWTELADADMFQRREGARKIMATWGAVLGMDLSYCPECPYNERDRQRGRVDLPRVPAGETLRVMRYLPLGGPMLSKLSPFEFERGLPPGLYRCQWLDSAGRLRREADFEACAMDERYDLALNDIHLEIRRGMRHFEQDSFSFARRTIEVPPFWIMSSPVRWRDLGLALSPAEVELLKTKAEGIFKGRYDSTDPAILSYQDAQTFAARVGARVPTLAELVIAWRHPGTLPENLEYPATGELATGLVVNGDRTVVRYSVLDSEKRIVPRGFTQEREFGALSSVPTGDEKHAGYTFRLALSDCP